MIYSTIMTNILLVNPSQAGVYGKMKPPVQMHMGLAYIASVLENRGNGVEILDIDAEGLDAARFTEVLKKRKPDVVGFTVTTPTFSSSLELAELVKKHNSGTYVIFGGIHPTIRPFETIQLSYVDIVVIGEGELTFSEIVEALEKREDLSSVKGIMFKAGGKTKETPPRQLLSDLDSLPFPSRTLFKSKVYSYPDALYRETASMITSRGCPGMCSYCNANRIFKRVFRARSAGNVLDEMELLTTSMGIKEIHIWDDNFVTDKKRVLAIRDEILKRNIRVKIAFPNGLRADFLDEGIMRALKEMGVYSIAIGVESGSEEILKKAHKGIKLERIEEVFHLAKKLGLETWAFFIIGLLGETSETIKKTIAFAKKLNPDIAKFHILKPYPGTEVYDELKSLDFILTEDYDKFGIHTPPVHRLENLSPRDMLMWQKKAYKSFYLRPSTIINQALRIKTLNRLKLNFEAGAGLLKTLISS
ncbi:MAG: cobalamin B12-binding domain-containing protein [Candidatus Omnitrophica bacterium]|nr:cobalamin B12-binding domain-containing protein [Candidatus Omnitrophota bacterium]